MQEQQNVHPDRSRLSKDSDFYKPEDKRSTKEKLASMDFKEKTAFIAQYYGLKIAAVVVGVIVVIYLILHFALQKESVLNVMAVNAKGVNTSADADTQSFYDDFMEQNNINTRKSKIAIDSDMSIGAGSEQETGITNMLALQVQLMAGTEDVLLANEELIAEVGQLEYLADLSEYLSMDIMEKYADEIVYATFKDSKESKPVGIRLTDNAWIADSGWFANGQDGVISICAGVKNEELSTKFLLYVLGESK